jgi:Ca2+-binding RTX toxin-like protein
MAYLDLTNGNDSIALLPGQAGPLGTRALAADDFVQGTAGDDIIFGNQGNDTLAGVDGNDFLLGGQGNDLIVGGNGNDILAGNVGDDFLQGDAGNDILRGGEGNDVLIGGAGNDYLAGDFGTDTMIGGDGADIFGINVLEGFASVRNADIIADFQAGVDVLAVNAQVNLHFDSSVDYSNVLGLGGGARDTVVRLGGATGPILAVILDADERDAAIGFQNGPGFLA